MGLHLSHDEHDCKRTFTGAQKTKKRSGEDKQASKDTDSGHFIARYFKLQENNSNESNKTRNTISVGTLLMSYDIISTWASKMNLRHLTAS